MKRTVFLFTVITLGGCVPEQAKDVAACRTEADRFFHTYETVDPNDPSSQYIIGCMTARGYDFTIFPTNCDPLQPMATQPACYVPDSLIDRVIDQFRHTPKSD